jgi:hypothetical protein
MTGENKDIGGHAEEEIPRSEKRRERNAVSRAGGRGGRLLVARCDDALVLVLVVSVSCSPCVRVAPRCHPFL